MFFLNIPFLFAQPANDNCTGAIVLTVNTDLTCGNVTAGTTTAATQSLEGCEGTADDDVWYSFIATSENHRIKVSNATEWIVIQAFSGSCIGFTSLYCNYFFDSEAQFQLNNLTIGTSYYLRVYTDLNATSTDFNICIGTPPTPPANDNCENSITVEVNNNLDCGIIQLGTTLGATESLEGCNGDADDDVWYKFTATATIHRIIIGDLTEDIVLEFFSSDCNNLISLSCIDNTIGTEDEVHQANHLTIGTTYYIRIYSYYEFAVVDFSICIGTASNPPANDDCTGAINVVVNNNLTCTDTLLGSTLRAIQSLEGCSGSADDDVWYKFTAINTRHKITISNATEDVVFEVFSGNCTNLTTLVCQDTGNDSEVYQLNDLIIGTTYRFRVYTYYALQTTNFTICIATPPYAPDNDDCNNAISLTINPNLECEVTQSGTTAGATSSLPGCIGIADDDVWYKFVATAPWHQLKIANLSAAIVMEVYAGTCASPTSLTCEYFGEEGDIYQINHLQAGETYYLRLYTLEDLAETSFTICLGAPLSNCTTGDVLLTTQSEVALFAAAFSTCDSLKGNLTISGGNAITDLSALSFIEYISGNLKIINNYTLQNINGFENLKGVGGDVNIEDNTSLDSIVQFLNISKIGGEFSITNNDALQTLKGLENLDSIGTYLSIQNNEQLINCSGICHLVTGENVGESINIINNPSACSTKEEVQSTCAYSNGLSTLFINSLPDRVEEGDSLQFVIKTNVPPLAPLTVYFLSSNDVEAPLPESIEIPAGRDSMIVKVALPDDDEPEENELITITASALYLTPANGDFTLTNENDIPAIQFEIFQDTVVENIGLYEVQGIISRLNDVDSLTINLGASQLDGVNLPTQITIPSGQTETKFSIGILDNEQIDGLRNITITAKVFLPSCECEAPANSNGVQSEQLVVVDNDGPSLSLLTNPTFLKEGTPDAGTLTIQRNTDINIPLTVNLTVSDATEINLPATVTIPQGKASVIVPLETLVNSDKDGNRQINIQAKAMGLSQGIAWVTITDINKPDLLVTKVALSKDTVASSESFQFTSYITNIGYSTVRSGVGLKAYLSTDERLDESDEALEDYSIDIPIPSGDKVVVTNLVEAPIKNQKYYLLFQVNPYEEVTEILLQNNISEAVPIVVETNYTGTALVTETTFVQGQLVPIQGTAKKGGGVLVPNVDLSVFVKNGDNKRNYPVKTDSSGNYQVNFLPLPNEAGHYLVGVNVPGEMNETTQDSFDIPGVQINDGANLTWTILLNDTLEGKLAIKNLSNIPLANYTISPVNLPAGGTLVFDTIPLLGGQEMDSIAYTISGIELSPRNEFDVFTLASKSNGKNLQRQKGYYLCQSLQGNLVIDKNSINTTISPDKSTTVELRIYNNGVGETGEISIDFPEGDWLKLKSPSVLPSMESGDTVLIIVEFIPVASLELNTPASGNFLVNTTNANNLDIPFTVEKVSENTGHAVIDAIDQYTYFTAEAPHVANARVRISHYFTGEVYADGYTDSLGLFRADSLPEGKLRLVIDAVKHKSYDGIITIQPGKTIEEEIFLEFQAISFSWEVVPTTVEDEYEVSLVMEFETNVPAPVVVMEGPDEMPALEGEETYDFFVTATNQGLITANELELRLPEDPEYEFSSNYTTIDLLAQQAIQIPVRMRRKGSANNVKTNIHNKIISIEKLSKDLNIPTPTVAFNSTGGGSCVGAFSVGYWYICQDTIWSRGAKSYEYPPGRDCPIGTISGSGTGFIGTFGVGASSGLNCASPIDCIAPLAKAIVGCLDPTSVSSLVFCIDEVLKIDAGKKFGAGTILGCLSAIPGPIGCIFGLFGAAAECAESGGSLLPNRLSTYGRNNNPDNSEIQQIINNFYAFNEGHTAKIKIDSLYFGELRNNENYREILKEFTYFLDNEVVINTAQEQEILEALSEFDISPSTISVFISGWNETIEAWNNNIFSPTVTYPNIIDKTQLNELWEIFANANIYAQNQEYDNIYEMYIGTYNDLEAYIETATDPDEENAQDGVCASVTIQISQSVTMTREAFEGTLKLNNGHPTDSIKNLSLNLKILDENGVLSNDLFEIETTELNTLTEINGKGSLAAEKEGYAKILFIPEYGAAPQNPMNYSFGGTISYLDPFTETTVTLPLVPANLKVNPSPNLFLRYFMQRDIYGDDPLTPFIEPIIPAELAVMVENNGYGQAQNVVIESAQPKIIDNQKGLAVNFNLTGSNLQGEPANLGLTTIDFGNVEARKTKIGQWYFTSDLLGHFTDFETKLVHLSSRGNPDLSLISGTKLHELIRSIEVYGAADDGIHDFLTNEIPDREDTPDAIYLSQGNTVYDVYKAIFGQFNQAPSIDKTTTILETRPTGLGWNYLKINDLGKGQFKILSVIRISDGQEIPLKNAWLSHVTLKDGKPPVYQNKFHFIDNFETLDTARYTIVWEALDTNPPYIQSISGYLDEVTADQVKKLTLTFSEPIIDSTFNHEDLVLRLQGGPDLIDENVSITKIDDLTYELNLTNITTGNGYYVFTAQAAGIKDITGTAGNEGEQIAWTQFLSVPSVKSFIGFPKELIGNSFDTVQLLFNLPIDDSAINADRFFITKNDIKQAGTITVELLDAEKKLFKLSGLGQLMPADGAYELNIDLLKIKTNQNVFGLDTQAIILTLDTQIPTLETMVQIKKGALDAQHYTGMTLTFNEALATLDTAAVKLLKGNVNQQLDTIIKVTDSWYEIYWQPTLTYPTGAYNFVLDLTKITDKAGNNGVGEANKTWSVNRIPDVVISNLKVSPDLGFSAIDRITTGLNLDVSFDINKAARNIRIYQNDFGTLRLLKTIISANSGTVTTPVNFKVSGNTAIKIKLLDLLGNEVEADKSIFLDNTGLLAKWQFTDKQELRTHPDTIVIAFSEKIANLTNLSDSSFTILFNNSSIPLSNWTFSKLTDTTYQFSGLSELGNNPGNYQIKLDLSPFQKYSSGLKGTGDVSLSWIILDTNEAPVANAGSDTTLIGIDNFILSGIKSYDPNGDALQYTWYPPEAVTIGSLNSRTPTFSVEQPSKDKEYVFLLSVSDGKKSSTDAVRVRIKLVEETCYGGVDLFINDNSIKTDTFSASNSISSRGIINKDTTVVFEATNTITLQEGFYAKNGSVFSARIADCKIVDTEDIIADTLLPKRGLITNKIQIEVSENIGLKVIPNPFFESTKIQFTLEKAAQINMSVYNLAGKRICVLAKNIDYEKGQHEATFDASNNNAGVYLLVLQTLNINIIEKIVLVK